MNEKQGHNNDRLEHTERTSFFAAVLQTLVFPLSPSGITTIVVFIFLPMLLNLVMSLIPFGGLLLISVRIIIGGYFYWYLINCVHKSAIGEKRAPNVVAEDPDYDVSSMLWQIFQVLVPLLLCIGPAVAYWGAKKQTDFYFWLILCCGGFLLPVSLLSVMMHDSLSGLNPLILLISIVRGFVSYLGVVAMFYLPLVIFGVLLAMARPKGPASALAMDVFFKFAGYYLLMVAAHVIGRFYYINKDKLDWEV